MIDVVEQVIERHPKVKNEGIPEASLSFLASLSVTPARAEGGSDISCFGVIPSWALSRIACRASIDAIAGSFLWKLFTNKLTTKLALQVNTHRYAKHLKAKLTQSKD